MGNVATKERSRSSSVSSSQQFSPSGSSRRPSVVSNGISSRRSRNNSAPNQEGVRSSKSKGKGKSRYKEEIQNLILDPSEMVDGGYLQPQGVYSGPQDFKYKVVRELIIDRKLAPFYKGLSDFDENWTDRQLLAAVRGLPIPQDPPGSSVASPLPEIEPVFETDKEVSTLTHDLSKHQISDDLLSISIPNKPALASVFGENAPWDPVSPALSSPANSVSNIAPSSAPALTKLNSFASNATFSDSTETTSPPMSSSPAIPFPSIDRTPDSPMFPTPNSPAPNSPALSQSTANNAHASATPPISAASSQLQYSRNRAHTSSRYGPSPLPNRVPQEIILYREALECPICFLFYPKLINLTRCCAQPICTECFVQIKRADPHLPHDEEPDPNAPPEVRAEGLISEAACCPYCMVPELGVTFVPPPYRTGIGASGKRHNSLSPLALFNSSTISLNSKNSQAVASPDDTGIGLSQSSSAVSLVNPATRRRGSLPPTAPDVVTTDQIRPDWKIKLASARARVARRSAAASALHASAFMNNDAPTASGRTKEKSSSRLRSSRFGRLSNSQSKSKTSPQTSSSSTPPVDSQVTEGSNSRRVPKSMVDIAGGKAEEIEDMMFLEAVKLSMREEEERQLKNGNKNSSNSDEETSTKP